MSPRVLQPTREELLGRRERLLERARLTRDELEARAEAGTLSSDLFWLLEDIRSVEFLLGDDGDE